MKIITTIDEVQDHIPVQMTSEIDVIKPFLSNIERSFLKKLIGIDQFKAFVTIYQTAFAAHTAASESEQENKRPIDFIVDEEVREALNLAQKLVVGIGYHNAVPILSVKIGSSGIQVFSNTDTKQAFNWQVEDVKTSLLDIGYEAIEELLTHLEESPDKFPEYIDSPEFISNEEFLINSATDFSKHFEIKNSRFVFSSISYLIRRIEMQVVKPLLGSEFFALLKESNLTGKYKILADDYIKPSIALLTGAKAILERVITLDNGVARINLVANYEAAKNSIVAERDQIKDTQEQLINDGNKFLQDGLQFIADNILDFPDYTSPLSKKNYNVLNNPTGGVYLA
ncbi:DUF6712 family protein [Pedobacter sp. Leaf250]|uniref:DUF6712 family protein n=1 Tax=Pedobacter sp. Leaf250 TaxID=2876559 RepID=UPI001E2AE614|nr:DUF6712 family protein [Pedobacter sp. Leaf250]